MSRLARLRSPPWGDADIHCASSSQDAPEYGALLTMPHISAALAEATLQSPVRDEILKVTAVECDQHAAMSRKSLLAWLKRLTLEGGNADIEGAASESACEEDEETQMPPPKVARKENDGTAPEHDDTVDVARTLQEVGEGLDAALLEAPTGAIADLD